MHGTALRFGLTTEPPLVRYQAADVMAKIVAERLVEHLDRSGFVVILRIAKPAMSRVRLVESGQTTTAWR